MSAPATLSPQFTDLRLPGRSARGLVAFLAPPQSDEAARTFSNTSPLPLAALCASDRAPGPARTVARELFIGISGGVDGHAVRQTRVGPRIDLGRASGLAMPLPISRDVADEPSRYRILPADIAIRAADSRNHRGAIGSVVGTARRPLPTVSRIDGGGEGPTSRAPRLNAHKLRMPGTQNRVRNMRTSCATRYQARGVDTFSKISGGTEGSALTWKSDGLLRARKSRIPRPVTDTGTVIRSRYQARPAETYTRTPEAVPRLWSAHPCDPLSRGLGCVNTNNHLLPLSCKRPLPGGPCAMSLRHSVPAFSSRFETSQTRKLLCAQSESAVGLRRFK